MNKKADFKECKTYQIYLYNIGIDTFANYQDMDQNLRCNLYVLLSLQIQMRICFDECRSVPHDMES